jgi:hypothetical protein
VGADVIRAALARKLATTLEDAPPYAVSRIGNVLARLVDQLDAEDEIAEALNANLHWLKAS